MNILELVALYVAAGSISAFVLHRKKPTTGRAKYLNWLLALFLWPLWLPVALACVETKPEDSHPNASNTERTLLQAYDAVKGTPLEKLLPKEAVERISRELRNVVARDRELSQLLAQPNFDLQIARERVTELERCRASTRALTMAKRHVEDVERLAALHARDRQLLAELGDWLMTLRTQLVLARYSASNAEGVSDIFAEVCSRVEVLGSTLEEPNLVLPEPPTLSCPSTFF
jgi:hypothetical protein